MFVCYIATGENSGDIARNASLILDREEVESYFILVMATDGGSMPRSATANISITILVRGHLLLGPV